MKPGMPSDPNVAYAQRTIVRLGLVVSSIFFFLGFPCGSGYAPPAFRATCVGYFVGNAIGHFLDPGRKRLAAFRFAMVSNSVSSCVISYVWCMGFGEWCILQLLESSFQMAGAILLLERDVLPHTLGTLGSSMFCYILRQDLEAHSSELARRVWIAVGVGSVTALVAGMSWTGYMSIAGLRRKIESLWRVLTADLDDFSSDAVMRLARAANDTAGEPLVQFVNPTMSSGSSDRSTSDTSFRGQSSSLSAESATMDTAYVKQICPFKDVTLHRRIGMGSFGSVYYGHTSTNMLVAVKVIVPRPNVRQKTSPLQEARIAVDLVHRCVVRTHTYCARRTLLEGQSEKDHGSPSDKAEQDGDGVNVSRVIMDPARLREAEASRVPLELWIMQEWCDRGTLAQMCLAPRYAPADIAEVCHILSDIASGGEYLHARDIIHGDLTGNNVLIASSRDNSFGYVCKVCDFGLARVLEEQSSAIFTSTMGTVSHMPPEMFQMEKSSIRLSKKADIYALGILLYQVCMGVAPFTNMYAPQIILYVAQGRRPELDARVPATMRELYDSCVKQDSCARPTFTDVIDSLKLIA